MSSTRTTLHPRSAPTASSSADALVCARIARSYARTFSLAGRLLPAPKRRAAFALYAFCRIADDLVDAEGSARGSTRVAETRAGIDGLRGQLERALSGAPDDAIFRELAWTVGTFGVPAGPLRALIDGVARDLETSVYATWSDLASYCAAVASTVGEMCTHVFGVDGGDEALARALSHARTLGLAMQLTNILRDVGEDARRGRCYLPADELARFDLDPDRVRSDPEIARRPGWAPFMRFQIARARALYAAASPGIPLLERDARPCATACAAGYASILNAIERLGYDTWSTRAHVATAQRLGILWMAWRRPGHALAAIEQPSTDDLIEWA